MLSQNIANKGVVWFSIVEIFTHRMLFEEHQVKGDLKMNSPTFLEVEVQVPWGTSCFDFQL